MKNIGFIGVGTMGLPMALNLIKNNHSLSFYDPFANNKTIEALIVAGAKQEKTIREVCKGKDFLISMLPIGENVKEVALGEDGIINQDNTNLIYIDMSTILPKDSVDVSNQLKTKNIQMFDAPVARLVNNAIDGTLLIMVGGSLQDFPKIEEILKCMGSDVVYCGTIGSGSKMKVINNYMAIVSNILTAETLSMVHKSGIDQKLAIELMSTTAAGKGHMNFSYPKKVLINDIGPGFKNVLALKDLRLAIEHGESEGIELTSGKSVLSIYEKAMDTKYKDLDWTAMFNFVKESNNLD
jgi:4-hydroxybutyrate dehydrogenase/sulfolactaldehyde 3-reductase|tara:strand:+ start:599 stop:1486 length:888 start_codon:yes stop_codon:yes gene_type:complete